MTDHTQQGDALRGEKVLAQARSISRPETFMLSSEHRGRRVVLRDSVYCVIDIPMRAIQHKRR